MFMFLCMCFKSRVSKKNMCCVVFMFVLPLNSSFMKSNCSKHIVIDRINNALYKTQLEAGYAALGVFDHAHKWCAYTNLPEAGYTALGIFHYAHKWCFC